MGDDRSKKVDADRPVHDARFIEPYTSLRREGGEDEQCGRILRDLGSDPGMFVAVPARHEEEADDVLILRHTLMNPFPMDGPRGRSYIDMCWDFQEEAIDAALVEMTGVGGVGRAHVEGTPGGFY